MPWIIRLILHIPIYVFFLAIGILPYLVGWLVVPIAAMCGAYRITDLNQSKPADGPIYHFTWGWMYLWDNTNDGIACRNYINWFRYLGWWPWLAMLFQTVYWSCWRNPVNNQRRIPFFSFKIDPEQIGFVGSFTQFEPDDWATEIQKDPYWMGQTLKYDTKMPHWFFCWQGWRSNFYWQFKLKWLFRFWIGSGKLYPDSIYKIPDYLKDGTTAVIQLKVVG